MWCIEGGGGKGRWGEGGGVSMPIGCDATIAISGKLGLGDLMLNTRPVEQGTVSTVVCTGTQYCH